MLEQFNNDDSVKVLVANHKTGGTGLNLQVAPYMVFYESPPSSIARSQAERRSWRMGQKNSVFIYDLVMKGTVDERILFYNKQGKDLLKALMDGSEKL